MKLFLLERGPETYGEIAGMVVRARDESHAREVASARHGDEGKLPWVSDEMSTCRELSLDGEACVLMRDCFDGPVAD